MRRTLIHLLVVTSLMLGAAGTTEARPAQTQPVQAESLLELELGFRDLADQIPDVADQPLEDEHWGPNADRFEWEGAPSPQATAPSPLALGPDAGTAAPSPTIPARHSPDVKAMDDSSGGPGVVVKQWMQEVDAEWERVWGWRPSRPTTVYLYFDGYLMADGLAAISGYRLEPWEREEIARWVHGLATRDQETGGWAVLLNLSRYYGQSYWELDTRSVLIHEYAHVMQLDVAGEAGPTWFREGMAQLSAYVTMPDALADTDRLATTSDLSCENQLPSLRSLNDAWYVVFGMQPQIAYGMSYFAVKHLADRVGGRPLLEVLERTARGEDFERALESVTGYSLERLDAEYRHTPCEAYR